MLFLNHSIDSFSLMVSTGEHFIGASYMLFVFQARPQHVMRKVSYLLLKYK